MMAHTPDPLPTNTISRNPLVALGLALVAAPVPVPHVKVLGVVSIAAGLGLELWDEIQRRRPMD